MKKLIKPAKNAEYEYFCDATNQKLDNGFSLDLDAEPLELEMNFDGCYGSIFDGQPETLHFGKEFSYKFLDWFRQEYPESEFIKRLVEDGFFDRQPEEDYQADKLEK